MDEICGRLASLIQIILKAEMALPQSMTLFLSSFISPNPVKVIPRNHFFNFTLSSKFDSQYKAVRIATRVQALKSSDGAGRYDSDSDSDDDSLQGMENDPYSMSLEERKEWRHKIRQMMVKQVTDKKRDIQEVELGDGDVRYISDSDSDNDDDTPRVKENDPDSMTLEERQEWRKNIRQVMEKKPDIQEELDPVEKKNKMQKLLADYPLVVEEDDPDWPEDADGWGFSFGQFFDKITITNNKKANDDDDDDDENEIVWQDDNYIRPIKDIKSSEWEETVFKDISPLIILAHNRYKRPKENERIRNDLEKAVHIIWNCGLPSPRCVALDAVIETELVAALRVSVFPEVIFTKAGKILFRDKETRSADEFSKIMAFFYFGAAKPPCLNNIKDCQEDIPSFNIDNPVS